MKKLLFLLFIAFAGCGGCGDGKEFVSQIITNDFVENATLYECSGNCNDPCDMNEITLYFNGSLKGSIIAFQWRDNPLGSFEEKNHFEARAPLSYCFGDFLEDETIKVTCDTDQYCFDGSKPCYVFICQDSVFTKREEGSRQIRKITQ